MATSSDNYIPRPDGDFDAWVNQYFPAVDIWWKAQGLDTAALSALNQALEEWRLLYPSHVAAQAAAEGARQAKDLARAQLEQAIRPVTRFVQSYPSTTNADRASMGISVRDGRATPAAAPTTRPKAIATPTARFTHTLRLTDESTPTSKARPKGVLGAEVWVKLVEPGTGQAAPGTGQGNSPAAPSDPGTSAQSHVPGFAFLTLTTRSTIRTDFRAADGGKTALYLLRWINTRGEAGPWSEVTTATVAA